MDKLTFLVMGILLGFTIGIIFTYWMQSEARRQRRMHKLCRDIIPEHRIPLIYLSDQALERTKKTN